MDQPSSSPSEVESALRERVKELTCLYMIAQVSSNPTSTLRQVFKEVVNLLPSAWQFPDDAASQITFDDETFVGGSREPYAVQQKAPLLVHGVTRGSVAIGYPALRTRQDGTAFLPDEQRLLDEVARQLSLMVDRKETAAEQERLHTKLRHADRLATIGQLAAGVAHELNEPIGGVLGFAQLLAKTPNLPEEAQRDIRKIESAALHARETIRRLMTFARQTPPRDARIDINQLIEASAEIWAPRCEAEGVDVEYVLDKSIPEFVADGGQLRQVITNLAVNALQAMAGGGTLRIETTRDRHWVQMLVTDTGLGIAPEILPRVFDPFFTTKDVDHGTGLGLSVVHGIVSGHGGRISFESTPSRGTRVKVRLPLHRPPGAVQENGGIDV